ncbi:MAG: hypothetical protein ACLP19_26360 [Xanthobacteraceae bacterium]
MKEYDAGKIIAGLHDLHPNFYPSPATAIEVTQPHHRYTLPIQTDFLTRDDLVSLYGKAGDFLHRGSIKKLLKAKMPIENAYSDIWDWLKKIGTLLSTHQIALLDGKTWFLCFLSATALAGRCQVAIAEAPSEKPPSVVTTRPAKSLR